MCPRTGTAKATGEIRGTNAERISEAQPAAQTAGGGRVKRKPAGRLAQARTRSASISRNEEAGAPQLISTALRRPLPAPNAGRREASPGNPSSAFRAPRARAGGDATNCSLPASLSDLGRGLGS